MGNILAVTGASGKSGKYFLQLLAQNHERVNRDFAGGVRILLHKNPLTDATMSAFVKNEQLCGELEDEKFLEGAFADVDTVVHIAGIHWSREVVSVAAKCRVRRLIMVHTTGIYSKYKEAGEEYRNIDSYVYDTCREHNIILTILRPTMIYGTISDRNVVTFIKMVDRLPIMPVVNGARYGLQPVHFQDLSKAYLDVLFNEGITGNKDYILSGGKEIQLREMLVEIAKNLDKRIRFFSVPYPIAYAGALCVYGVSLTKIDFREKVKRLCEPRVYGHEDAAKDWGYAPRSFEEGIVDEVKEYRESL